jgi:hypothetical protein
MKRFQDTNNIHKKPVIGYYQEYGDRFYHFGGGRMNQLQPQEYCMATEVYRLFQIQGGAHEAENAGLIFSFFNRILEAY